MTNLDSIVNSRDITLSTNVNLIKAMVFSSSHVWLLESDYKESWEQKNLWFWTVGLERTLRVHWTKTRWNQSILKQINPECSLEGLMLKLKLQYLGTWYEELTPWKRPWCWERLKAEEGGDRGWDGWMASPTQWTLAWANSGRPWRTGKPDVLQPMGSQSRTRLSDWKTTTRNYDPTCCRATKPEPCNQRSRVSQRGSHMPLLAPKAAKLNQSIYFLIVKSLFLTQPYSVI